MLKKTHLTIDPILVSNSYKEDYEYKINYLTIPTPTRLFGKTQEEIYQWRVEMNNKKNKYNKEEKNE